MDKKSRMLYVDVLSLFPSAKRGQGASVPTPVSAPTSTPAAPQRDPDTASTEQVSTRAAALPHAGPARVAGAGIRKIIIEKVGLPPGSTFSVDHKNLMIPVGSGELSLVSFKRNGVTQALMPQFSLSEGLIKLVISHLPLPAFLDKYEIHVTDALGVSHEVRLSATVGRSA